MPSTFFGLQIAGQALNTQQLAVDVTAHNIANSSNPDYTRQIPNFVATPPYTFPALGHDLTLGTGVTLASVTRARDAFVDDQYRTQNSLLSYWTQKQDGLNKIQGIMNEPSDNSLSSELNAFWNDWSTLANNAQDSAARTTVQQQAVTLADMFNQISSQINDLQTTYQTSISTGVSQINTITKQISQLNVQINQEEADGANPNDLKDQRDSLVDQLSQYYKVSVVETQNGPVSNYEVKIGNNDLVNGSTYNTLSYTTGDSDVKWDTVSTPSGANQPTAGAYVNSGDGIGGTAAANTGSIKGNLDVLTYLNNTAPNNLGLKQKYDNLAQGIADAVNEVQEGGYDLNGNPGGAFFTYNPADPAGTMAVASSILGDVTKIAAASTNTGQADGSNAQNVANLGNSWSSLVFSGSPSQPTLPAGGNPANPVFTSASVSDYYNSLVSGVGVDGQEANTNVNSEQAMVNNLSNQRQSYSGVSLDQEMTNMITYQKSYTAAARVVTMMDDMLNTIVTGLGITR